MSQVSKKVVIVLCPNGRRVTVKASTSTSIGQIIEEACLKQSLDPLCFNIKHLKRALDPSSSLYYSNIPNHAQLELIEANTPRVESCVTVNLVTETGQRLIADFPPSSTLWDILVYHDSNSENFFIPNSDSDFAPFIVYTMKKIYGDELKSTTLKSLGLFKGKCMMRYNVQQCSESAKNIDSSPSVIVQPKVNVVQPKLDMKNEITPAISVMQSKCHEVSSSSSETKMECSPTTEPNEIKESNSKREDISVESELLAFNVASSAIPEKENTEESVNVTKSDDQHPMESSVSCSSVQSNYFPEGSGKVLCSQGESKSLVLEQEIPSNSSEMDYSLDLKESEDHINPEPNLSPEETVPKFTPLSDHDSILFNLDEAPPTDHSHENDEFFELSTDEVRKMYQEQLRQLKEMEEAPLMTQQLRQLEKDSRLLSAMNRHPVTQLRICFPDRHVIQANFKPHSTVQEVMDFLRPLLNISNMNFYLYTTFPRTVLSSNMTLVEAGCIPKARLYFGTEENITQFLSQETISKKSSFTAATNAIVKSKKPQGAKEPSVLNNDFIPQQRVVQSMEPDIVVSNRSTPQPSHKPKWFKLGTK